MTWDDDKSRGSELTSDEWDAHVQDQKERLKESDVVDLLEAGENLSWTYSDGSLTVDTSALDQEEVEDVIAAAVQGDEQVSVDYDDTNGVLTVSVDAPTQSEFNSHSSRHESDGDDELDVTGLSGELADPQDPKQESVEDIVGALVSGGGNISVSYDDENSVVSVDTSALNEEEVEDAVSSLLVGDSNISVGYDDSGDVLTVGLADDVSVSSLSANTLDTEDATLDISSEASNDDIPTYQIDSPGGVMADNYRVTDTVGTTATKIAAITDSPVTSGMVTVVGYEKAETARRFTDIVSFGRSASTVDVVSQIGRGGPDARTYETGDYDGNLRLAMDSTEYQVATRVVETRLGL